MQATETKRLSCGIVVLTGPRELLLCHVTGRGHWDLPKGGIDTGESPIDAALRETREETGLVFDANDLLDIGRHAFSERKQLHLFAARTERFDLARLSCESHFSHAWSGKRLPEMDDYGWFDFARASALCAPKMGRLLGEAIDLAALSARLEHSVTPGFLPQAARPAAPPAFASAPAWAA
jgi:putative (di)nucleoside polyphosphate hydrolase